MLKLSSTIGFIANETASLFQGQIQDMWIYNQLLTNR